MLINYIRYFCIYTCLVRWGSIRAKHIYNHGTYHTKRDTSNAFASWWCFKVCVFETQGYHIYKTANAIYMNVFFEYVLYLFESIIRIYQHQPQSRMHIVHFYRARFCAGVPVLTVDAERQVCGRTWSICVYLFSVNEHCSVVSDITLFANVIDLLPTKSCWSCTSKVYAYLYIGQISFCLRYVFHN